VVDRVPWVNETNRLITAGGGRFSNATISLSSAAWTLAT
jgi:hypothetical protein